MRFYAFVLLLALQLPAGRGQSLVVPARYANLAPLADELGNLQPALLQITLPDGKNGLLRLADGQEIIPPKYDGVMWHQNIVAAYTHSDGAVSSVLYTPAGKMVAFDGWQLLFSYRMEGTFERFLYLSNETTMGMADSDGNIRIPPGTYSTLESVSEGRVIAQKGAGWAVLDTNGVVLAQLPDAQMVESYVGGLARFQRNNLFGYLDLAGKEAIAAQYPDAFPFMHGLAVVSDEKGKSGCINPQGKWVVPASYDYCQADGWGHILTGMGEYQGLLDASGNLLISPNLYSEIQPLSQSLAIVRTGEFYGAIELPSAQIVLPLAFNFLAWDAETQHFTGSQISGMGLYDASGQTLISPQYQIVSEMQSDNNYELLPKDMVRIGASGPEGILWGYARSNGDILLPPTYEYVQEFAHDLAVVVWQGKIGMVNLQGKEVVPFGDYSAISYQNEGFYVVSDAQNQYGFVDKTGKEVVPAIYQEVYAFHNGFAAVQTSEGKWGVVNSTGKIVVSPQYEDIMPLSNGFFGVKQNGLWGVLRVE